jgi:hypothetical protein
MHRTSISGGMTSRRGGHGREPLQDLAGLVVDAQQVGEPGRAASWSVNARPP